MNTLAREGCKTELIQRLRGARPDSTRRWGRMTVHQMVCHLSDNFRMALGQKQVSDASSFVTRTLIKWIALYSPLRWRAGILTRPEVDQEIGGTKPGEFAADLKEAEGLLTIVASRTGNTEWPDHPIFGRMSDGDWMRWAYLHTDHHLRQFGL
jgi:Protein of unknown function (DUF1569)